jgi:hypothetical protein
VLAAAQSDDVRRALVALRDGLASSFDQADVNMRPQISGQLRAVLADLASLSSGKKESVTDEIRARREARRGATTTRESAAPRKNVERRRRGS